MKPFLKWAGGKGQILNDIQRKYPSQLGNQITRYCEPFVGGGAVLFDLLSKYTFEEILINDINAELINTYRIVRDDVSGLILLLSKLQEEFIAFDNEKRKIYYYEKRERFNHLKETHCENTSLEKSALFIFLNKTCFNGLYRVNSKGLFNVPMGAYKKPLICDKDNLILISNSLKNTKIKCGDYKDCFSFIDSKTFVYIDPPYRPLSETASFTAYSETAFDDKEQINLQKFVDSIHRIGAKVIISNSDPKNSDDEDTFFDNLYNKYDIARVTAKRMINCNGKSRGNISELLISNF